MSKNINLKKMNDSQLDGIAGGGVVEYSDDNSYYHAYCVCPKCGQKDLCSEGMNDHGISMSFKNTCPNCGHVYTDTIYIPGPAISVKFSDPDQ